MKQIHPEKMSAWSENRLQDIFAHYNRKYWQGRLPAYRLFVATMPEAMGLCESRSKLITLDVERHKSDREVRSTVLHEMAMPLLLLVVVAGRIQNSSPKWR